MNIASVIAAFGLPADIQQAMVSICKEPVKVNHSRITGIAKSRRAARKARRASK